MLCPPSLSSCSALSPAPVPATLPEIEARHRDKLWRGATLMADAAAALPSGFGALDAQLPGGGWPAHGLTELLLDQAGIGEMQLLAPALRGLTRAGRPLILVAPVHQVYPDGWAQLGIDVARIMLIQPEQLADRLWAIEQALKSAAFGALVAWLPDARPGPRHDQLRRLQVAAAGADGLSFILRPVASRHQASPAPLRLLLERAPPRDGRRLLALQVLKRRGPVLAEPLFLDLPEVRPLHWRAPNRAPSAPSTVPSTPSSTSQVSHHALGRPALSDAAAGSHPAPSA